MEFCERRELVTLLENSSSFPCVVYSKAFLSLALTISHVVRACRHETHESKPGLSCDKLLSNVYMHSESAE